MTNLNALQLLLVKLQLLLIAFAAPVQFVSDRATQLSQDYGSRPPYSGPAFAPYQFLSSSEAASVAPYILACESKNRTLGCILDSNHKYSCGPAQFQGWKTFWEPTSGIYGDPNNESTSVRMLLWGLENGYIQRWSCAKLEHILP